MAYGNRRWALIVLLIILAVITFNEIFESVTNFEASHITIYRTGMFIMVICAATFIKTFSSDKDGDEVLLFLAFIVGGTNGLILAAQGIRDILSLLYE